MRFLRYTALLLFFTGAPLAFAAIAFDTSNRGAGNISSGSVTFTNLITLATSNEYVICYAADTTNPGNQVTAITIGGVSGTSLDNTNVPNYGQFVHTFGAIVPSSGAINVVVTSSTDGAAIRMPCVAYSGVNTSTPVDVVSTTTNAGTSPLTNTITTTVTNDWVVSEALSGGGTTAASTGVNATRQQGNFTGWQVGDSNGVVAVGANSFTWTNDSSSLGYILDVALEPTASVVSVSASQINLFGDW